MIIRILLLAGLAAIGWFVFLRRNKLPFHIVTVFGLLAAGAVAVVMPATTNEVAHLVGVGRGADLVMYVSLVAVLFVLIRYYAKFVELQRDVTQLTRELAIMRAEVTHGEPRTAGAPAHGEPPRPAGAPAIRPEAEVVAHAPIDPS